MNSLIKNQKKHLATNLVWMVIQDSITGDDDGEWRSIMHSDIPNWIIEDKEVIGQMKKGMKVCFDPTKDCRWYRGICTEKPRMN